MSREAFLKAVGPRLAHVTSAENVEGIRRDGLLSAHDLAEKAGVPQLKINLRKHRFLVGQARLNHQKPLLHGRRAAKAMLDGHSPESWSAALDKRIFFWPERHLEAFAASLERDVAMETLWFDAGQLYDAAAEAMDLSPINSGNFLQGGANTARGDWIFVPVSAGLDAFRQNRVARGLVKSPDSVREVSIRKAIPPDVIARAVL